MALTNKLTAIGDAIRSKTGGSSALTLPQMASAISELVVPYDTITFEQRNAKTAGFISEVTYDPSDYTNSSISNYTGETTYRKDRPAGIEISIPESGTLTIQDGSCIRFVTVSAGTYTIDNLTPGNRCIYVVRNNTDKIVAAGILKPTGNVRMINGGGNTFNIRDLGGWSCDGGSLKYGLMFRGGELNDNNTGTAINLTNDQIKLFTDFLRIRDEIDLRGTSELDGLDNESGTADDITSSALGQICDYALYRINPYGATNAIQKERYAGAINRIINDVIKSKPCYIHCVEGADRTGTICALLEGLCGVSQSDLDKDYELTSMCGRLRTRNTTSPAANWKYLILNQISVMPGETFRDKVIAYVLDLGVSIESINYFRQATINGTPSTVRSPYSAVSLTFNLTHVTSSNNIAPRLYEPYTTELSPNTGYVNITGVSVEMGGTNITSAVYDTSSGLITIPRVTGNIVVTAEGVASYTNLVPTSTVSGGGSVYNGVGYKNGVYVSGASDGSDANYTATGYIPYPVTVDSTKALYIKGASWLSESHTRMSFYDSNYNYLTAVSSSGSGGFGGRFTKTELGTNYFKLEPVMASGNTSKIYNDSSGAVAFVRFSFKGDGADLIIATDPIG